MKTFKFYKYFTAFFIIAVLSYSFNAETNRITYYLFSVMIINTIVCALIWAYFHLNELNNMNEYTFKHYLGVYPDIVIKAKSNKDAENWLHKHYKKASDYYLDTIKT